MELMDEYFRDEYPGDKRNIERIDRLLNDVKGIFRLYDVEDSKGKQVRQWPYEIFNEQEIPPQTPSDDFSFNTYVMILYSLAVGSGRITNSPFIADVESPYLFAPGDKETKYFDDIFQTVLKKLPTRNGKSKSIDQLTESGTFGIDDPFTLSWLYELLKTMNHKGQNEHLRGDIIRVLYERMYESFGKYEMEKLLKLQDGNSLLNTVYPLLRMLQFYVASKKDAKKLFGQEKTISEMPHSYLSNIREYLINKIYRHLSFEKMDTSSFDAAELIFAMEGVLLLDKELDRLSDAGLIERFFEAVKNSQSQTPYWRPVRPLIINQQGMLLMPLSINIAASLLRICKLYEKESVFLFSKHIAVFQKYTDWLFTHTVHIKIPSHGDKEVEFIGWNSEHINDPHRIHIWESVMTVLFLVQYRAMYQQHIARESLLQTNLKVVPMKRKDDVTPSQYWQEERELREPLLSAKDGELKEYRTLRLIRETFIEPFEQNNPIAQKFSMMLYGPPGTGKTSVAEDLAKALEWPLITVTPSDFISHGSAQVEARAKSIFATLTEQGKSVILFDEIDHLLLDRDSEMYLEQGDMFQFMTPSMLVKIKELRNGKQSIFIIATNYAERIDAAIKRVGRIDQSFLMLPPNKAQRLETLRRHLGKYQSKYKLDIDLIKLNVANEILNRTLFATNSEIGQLAEETVKILKEKKLGKKDKPDDLFNKTLLLLWINRMPSPQVKLASYANRFYKDNNKRVVLGQLPYTEFLLLTYLRYETLVDGKKLDVSSMNQQEKKLVVDVIKLLSNEGSIPDETCDTSLGNIERILTAYLNDTEISQGLFRLYSELEKQA